MNQPSHHLGEEKEEKLQITFCKLNQDIGPLFQNCQGLGNHCGLWMTRAYICPSGCQRKELECEVMSWSPCQGWLWLDSRCKRCIKGMHLEPAPGSHTHFKAGRQLKKTPWPQVRARTDPGYNCRHGLSTRWWPEIITILATIMLFLVEFVFAFWVFLFCFE
jgi:hypothetical protein